MKIREILSEHRSDFTATMECEHCGATQKLTSGYHDNFYHSRVIPAMTCSACGRNREGVIPETRNDNGMVSVP